MLIIFMLIALLFAILAIGTPILRHSVLYASIFSLSCSFIYLLYGSPDVAIAQGVIGCTLSTVLFLVAIRKYNIYTVYYCYTQAPESKSQDSSARVRQELSKFSAKYELELDFILSEKDTYEISSTSSYDVIIEQNNQQLRVFGDLSNYHFEKMLQYLSEKNLQVICCPLHEERGGEY